MSKKENNLIDTTHKNLFCLCFRNRAKLTLTAITEIFSEYGNVVGINCPPREDGFYFVRYRSMEEAERCLAALEGHRDINLQPVKSRYKVPGNENQPRDKFNKEQFANGDNTKINKKAKFNAKQDRADLEKAKQSPAKACYNGSNKKENGAPNGCDSNERCGGTNFTENSVNFGESSSRDRSEGKLLVSERLARKFLSNESISLEKKTTEDTGNATNHLNALKLAELQKRRGINANTFQPQGNGLAYTESYKTIINAPSVPAAFMPPSIVSSSHSSLNSSRDRLIADEMPPPLVAGNTEEKQHVVVAWDIVIANIHSNLGINNVYQILRRFNPVHISDIETVPDMNLRFCYAYFKTQSAAIDAEEFLDGAEFHGRYLIALRSCRLEATANVF